MNLSLKILSGLGLGLIMGVLVSTNVLPSLSFFPEIIEPIGKLWVNAIRMTVIPLLMALLITSIAGQNNTSNAAKLSGKTILVFVLMILVCCVYTFLFAPPLLSLLNIDPEASQALLASSSSVIQQNTQLPPFSDWFIALIPANPIKAAADNQVLSLMVFCVLFALALLKISEKQRTVMVDFFSALKDAMYVLIGWIMALAPFGIFALVFPLTATLGVSTIALLGSFIGIACGLIVVMILLLYPLAVIVGKVPLGQFVRALAPVQIIGFSTRSSLASMPATVAATEQLGVSSRVSGVVLPFAVTMFKFASPIARTAGTYFIAHLYGIELGMLQLFVVAMTIGLFSFYSPGIPSGGLLIMAPIYLTLGLPVEGIGILIAVDLIVDMFITAANVSANVTVAVLMSKSERDKSV